MSQWTESDYDAFIKALEKCNTCKSLYRCGKYCYGVFYRPSLSKLLRQKLKRWMIGKWKL